MTQVLNFICRICLSNSNLKYISNYCDYGQAFIYEMLIECCSIKVDYNDGLPNKICQTCAQLLHIFYEFRKKSHITDRLLKEFLKTNLEIKDNLNKYINYLKNENLVNSELKFNLNNIQLESKRQSTYHEFKLDTNSKIEHKFDRSKTNSNYDDFRMDNADFKFENTYSEVDKQFSKLFENVNENLEKNNFNNKEIIKKHLKRFEENENAENELNVENNLQAPCENTSIDDYDFEVENDIVNIKFEDNAIIVDENLDENATECKKCKKNFETPKQYKTHYKNFHQKYKCQKCNIVIVAYKKFYHHLYKLHLFQMKCNLCEKTFTSKQSFRTHMNVTHSENKPQLPCPICDKKFTRHTSVTRHVKIKHEQQKFNCQFCSKSYGANGDLKKHIARNHVDNEVIDGQIYDRNEMQSMKIAKFICPICNELFSKKAKYIKHLKLHKDTDMKKITCEEFLNNLAVNRPPKQRDFLCQKCGKVFNSRTPFRDHINWHNNIKPYTCSFCDKRFLRYVNFAQHQLIHKNIRRYKCDYCGKGFIQHPHLVRHIRTHTGEKPFSCDHCGMRFSRKQGRDTHVRMHEGIKPYKCNDCDEYFYDSGRLYKHNKKFHQLV